MKQKLLASLSTLAVLLSCATATLASSTPLALLSGVGPCTPQMVDTNFGSQLSGLSFSGTITYDFYSPPLAAAATVLTSGKGGGVIYMRNTSTTSANDFSVSGRMQY